MIEFHLDIQGRRRPLNRHWEVAVGSCHAATALRQDWRDQLARTHRELGFRYVRFHGLFDDDMSVVRRPLGAGECILSFTNTDSIFDFLLSIGMKPFVELDFMPEALASGRDTIFHYKGNITPPADPARWAWVIRSFLEHCIGRYGRAEVRTWLFEVWNEPNLGLGSSVPGGRFWSGTMEDYFNLYDLVARTVKGVDAALRVGGPTTSNNAWIPEMIAHCREQDVPLDFISTHHYPTDVALGYGVEDSQNFVDRFEHTDKGDKAALLALAREYVVFSKEIWAKVDRGVLTDMARRARGEAGELPLYYTEWSSLAGLPSDGPFGASFIAKTVLDNRDLIQGSAYWTFSDLFEESGMPAAAFHGGFGLMTLQGIPKAPYRVFQLLHTLGDEIYDAGCARDTVDVYALWKEEAKALQLLCVNHQSLLHPVEAQTVRVSLSGLGEGTALPGEVFRVDETHANALGAWEAMGSPGYLTAGQVHALEAASALVREDITLERVGGLGTLTVELPPQGTALVNLYL